MQSCYCQDAMEYTEEKFQWHFVCLREREGARKILHRWTEFKPGEKE